MKIAIGSDHGKGFELKEKMIAFLKEKGYEVEDKGTYTPESCDYPDFARPVAEDVAAGKADKGIVICTTGIGVSITANKVKGIRCALCFNEEMAELTRLHNDSNVLALGAAVVSEEMAKKIAMIWLTTEFSGEERHARRIRKIEG
ncbi:MAG: ribose 5-phosphate isomerase B [Lachnospiraceae bacterium]|nr:ribose 5-phosphate isomerase B [Lachnospiraceae bacterium]MBP3295579.1 ribose 5-phosphate isomerase B [Lachnospiraceae bacterium]MCR5128540.1 ribose 5-phosphate isomerase B [Lachnospiraceae bacterium]